VNMALYCLPCGLSTDDEDHLTFCSTGWDYDPEPEDDLDDEPWDDRPRTVGQPTYRYGGPNED